jgi:glutamate N-acetyltransferase/amino-acid N-acetyltransferase
VPHPPAGFRFAARAAQIRKDGRIDVALGVADEPATAAGVFTRNRVRAAPVEIAEQRVATGRARAVLVNSGCANACTGEAGRRATLASTAAVAERLGITEAEVLPASTGVIGAVLPAEKLERVAPDLVAALDPAGWEDFSRAILTTDRWPKVEQRQMGAASLLAIAKGAGMIHPDMGPPHATMLAFLFTDARVEPAVLGRVVARASDLSFNAATVDGDTSTNDTVLALASGKSERAPSEDELLETFTDACRALARSMVADGEGARHVADIVVRGLRTEDDARTVARTVATSLLVKTALFGRDANWGRLLAAAGRSGVEFDPDTAIISIGGVEIVRDGTAVGAEAEARAAAVLATDRSEIVITLGSGPGTFRYLTSDLGHGYVDVNAGYRS